jgi:hypothetical protein
VILLGAEASAAYLETRAAARGEAKPTQDKAEDTGQSLPQEGPSAAPVVEVRTVTKDQSKTADSNLPPTTGDARHD